MRKNLNPKIWGAEGWAFLKSCAHACDAESFSHYETLVSVLPHVLPCEQCRFHAVEYIRDHPPSRDLVRWIEDFETAVRLRTREELPEQSKDGPAAAAYLGLGLFLVVLAFCCLSALLCVSRRILVMARRS